MPELKLFCEDAKNSSTVITNAWYQLLLPFLSSSLWCAISNLFDGWKHWSVATVQKKQNNWNREGGHILFHGTGYLVWGILFSVSRRLFILGSYERETYVHCTLELSSHQWKEKTRSSIKRVSNISPLFSATFCCYSEGGKKRHTVTCKKY